MIIKKYIGSAKNKKDESAMVSVIFHKTYGWSNKPPNKLKPWTFFRKLFLSKIKLNCIYPETNFFSCYFINQKERWKKEKRKKENNKIINQTKKHK